MLSKYEGQCGRCTLEKKARMNLGTGSAKQKPQSAGYVLPKCHRALGLRERVGEVVCEHPFHTGAEGQSCHSKNVANSVTFASNAMPGKYPASSHAAQEGMSLHLCLGDAQASAWQQSDCTPLVLEPCLGHMWSPLHPHPRRKHGQLQLSF